MDIPGFCNKCGWKHWNNDRCINERPPNQVVEDGQAKECCKKMQRFIGIYQECKCGAVIPPAT